MSDTNKLPVIPIDGIDLVENNYVDHNGNIWSAVKLIEASKQYKPFDLPLAAIDMHGLPWGVNSILDFIHHVKRIDNTNLKHPIILDDEGIICDGWHRVAKAVLKGDTSIKAIRLLKMPPRDGVETKPAE